MHRTSGLALVLSVGLLAGCQEYELHVYDGADVFYQDPPSAVDILLVVDNSCSMDPYQQELSTNFEQFISFFTDANIEYQIGVVTTDVIAADAGKIRGQIITPDTPDGNAIFQSIVQVGVTGYYYEMGLESAYLALTPPNVDDANGSFLRDDASLSVIFVSDEEDASPMPVYEYVRAFQDIKGQRQRDIFNASALVVTDESTCGAGTVSTRGDRYIEMAQQTGGVVGNICSNTFEDIVTELSLNASRLQDTFYLSSEPEASTIEVSIEETAMPCDEGTWTYQRIDDRPAVVFERGSMPPPSTQIAIRYDYGSGDPSNFCSGGAATDDTQDTGGAQ